MPIMHVTFTVADLRFSEGGFYYSIVREASAKIFATTLIVLSIIYDCTTKMENGL